MSKRKYYYYVMVIDTEGPKMVTSIDYTKRVAMWDCLGVPMAMEKERAWDLAQGLTMNFKMAYPVVLWYELKSQPIDYSMWELQVTRKD